MPSATVSAPPTKRNAGSSVNSNPSALTRCGSSGGGGVAMVVVSAGCSWPGRVRRPRPEQDVAGHLAPGGHDDADDGEAIEQELADFVDPTAVGKVDLGEQHEVGVAEVAENQVPNCR